MKIFSKMLSRKPNPDETISQIDFDALERARREENATADDTGEVNASLQDEAEAPVDAVPSKPVTAKSEEPDEGASGWAAADWSDDSWDDDEDWGAEDDPDRAVTTDREHLVSEIRDAVGTGETGERKFGDTSEERLLEKTESEMTNRETSRRRSAMAHLKAAAAATKADRVLRNVVTRDPSADPEEQSPYRDDLAKVVRPQSVSRPISRQVSRPTSQQAVWDQGVGDKDAALFAESSANDPAPEMSVEDELAAAEAERLANAPADLSAEDFADDFGGGSFDDFEEDDMEEQAFPNSPFARSNSRTPSRVPSRDAAPSMPNAFDISAEEDDDEDDDFAPRPSSAVSEAVAFANASDDEVDQTPEEPEVRKKIWEIAEEVASEVEQTRDAAEPSNFAEVATAVSGRAGRSAGRVKTRMLGFQANEPGPKDVFEETAEKAAAPEAQHFPAGWIVVVEGPGRGASFTLFNGVSQMGRGEDQAVRLDFGDTSISRNNHAAIAYDDEQGKFFLGHGGKSNLVRLNGMPVLSTEEMTNGDQIRIGETTLKFVSLCGADFTWAGKNGE